MKIKLDFKLASLVIICLLQTSIIKSQNSEPTKTFEGKIIYSFIYQDRTGELNDEESKLFMGDEQVYYVKGNKYKSETNGMMKMSVSYLGGDTLYTQIAGMNHIFWIDTSVNLDTMINSKIEKNVDTINGLSSDLLTINSTEGVTKFYFNSKYFLSPEDYSKHKYGFWDFCIEKTKSFPLKNIIDEKDMYVEIVVKEIVEMEIDDSIFEIPNLPRVLSPE